MARLSSVGMVIPRVLVEFVQFATVNICNNDVKELTYLKALRRAWPVNGPDPFFRHPKENGKKRSGHARLTCMFNHRYYGSM